MAFRVTPKTHCLSARAASKVTGVHPNTIVQWFKRGKIKARTIMVPQHFYCAEEILFIKARTPRGRPKGS